MSEPLFNSIDAHAADERRAGRWDVSSVLISAKREIESLRTQLAAAEDRLTFTPSPEQWQETQSQLRAAKERLATAHRLLREAIEASEFDDEWHGNQIEDDWFVRAKKEVGDA